MKKWFALAFLIPLIHSQPIPAWAATFYPSTPVYVTAYENSSALSDADLIANANRTYPPYLQSVTIEWAAITSSDTVKIIWYDVSYNQMGETIVTSSGQTLSAPTNCWAAKISLTTGSDPGKRYVWVSQATDTFGNLSIFPAPDTSDAGSGGTTPPPSDGTTPPSSDPVLTELQNINSQLNTITGKLNTLIANSGTMISQLGVIGDYLSSINSLLNQAVNELQGVNSRLDTVNDKLDTVNSQLSAIKGKLNDIYTYFSTPRTANTITVNPSTPYFSPYPNMPEPPYTTPYQYNRDQYLPQMPPEEPSPGPLPPIPAPTVMEHEPPVQRDQPITKDTPLEREPAIRDQPLQKDPVVRDEPLPRDPVVRDTPLSRDPVVRDSPLSRDPVIQRDTPLQREEPIVRDAPLQRDPPLQPEPPL